MTTRLKKNNFDLLRLLFAAIVCVVHAHELSGASELGLVARFLSSQLAVKAFFVVSGFLIFMSFERSATLSSYFSKRLRRIYPAYFVVVMLCAVLLVLVSSAAPADYFSATWLRYVAANLGFLNFLQPALPGVFEANALPAVNGALWTLKIEVMFYCCVPVIVWLCRKISVLPVLAFCYVASVLYFYLVAPYNTELARQLPGQLSYFIAGAFFYYYLACFERYVALFVAAAIVLLLIRLPPFEPFALAAIVIFLALYGYVGNFGKYGDFSYGFYILHFPIIQLYLGAGWFDGRPWTFLCAVMATTALGAVALWHLVEKRFLARTSHYIGVSQEASASAAAAPSAPSAPAA
jgi:peptidoglycan/LPS O-acetylase OafA/YrhL